TGASAENSAAISSRGRTERGIETALLVRRNDSTVRRWHRSGACSDGIEPRIACGSCCCGVRGARYEQLRACAGHYSQAEPAEHGRDGIKHGRKRDWTAMEPGPLHCRTAKAWTCDHRLQGIHRQWA